jgi:Cu/Ag efflux protein CusF
MRRLILAVVLASGAGWALAQDPQAQPPTQPQQPAAPAAKDTKEMTAVVVATDAKVKTITVKRDAESGAAQPEATLSVDEKALTKLKSIRVGEKVKLVLKTDAMGKESVTSIEKSKITTPEK